MSRTASAMAETICPPHIEGRHPMLYFNIQRTEKYSIAMCYPLKAQKEAVALDYWLKMIQNAHPFTICKLLQTTGISYLLKKKKTVAYNKKSLNEKNVQGVFFCPAIRSALNKALARMIPFEWTRSLWKRDGTGAMMIWVWKRTTNYVFS